MWTMLFHITFFNIIKMIKKLILTGFILYSTITHSFGQIRTIIVIADEKDKMPLPYATIKVLHKPIGYISDSMGVVKVNMYDQDTLLLEYSGYQTAKVVVKRSADTIFLTPKVNELPEVTVRSYTTEKKYGTFPYKKRISLRISTSSEFAKTIRVPDGNSGYRVKAIFLPHGFNKNTPATCKLHLYKADAQGAPGEDILKEPVFITKKPSKNDYYFDLTEQNLMLTDTLLFIGIECIIENSITFDSLQRITDEKLRHKISENAPLKLFYKDTEAALSTSYNVAFFRFFNSQYYQWIPSGNQVYPGNFSGGLVIEVLINER